MSHIPYPHKCAPKIISTITLFCFYVMTLAQSVAVAHPENDTLNDLQQNRTLSQTLPYRDTIPLADPISTPVSQKKATYSAKSSPNLLHFLVGFLCLSTLVQKASSSNLHSLSISGGDDVCQWGWNADMFTDPYDDHTSYGNAGMLIGVPGTLYLIHGGSNANIKLATLGGNGITMTGASSSNYYDSSASSSSNVCKWGWNADMFNDDDKVDILIGVFPEVQASGKPTEQPKAQSSTHPRGQLTTQPLPKAQASGKSSEQPKAPASMKPTKQPKTQPSVVSNQVSVFYQYPLTEQPPEAQQGSRKPTKQPEEQPSVPPLG